MVNFAKLSRFCEANLPNFLILLSSTRYKSQRPITFWLLATADVPWLLVRSCPAPRGKGVGCIVDGVPPNLDLTEEDIQPQLTRRRPGQSRRAIQLLSGKFATI